MVSALEALPATNGWRAVSSLDDEGDEGRRRNRDAQRDRVRAELIRFLPFIEHELKGCEPERKKAEADVIDAARIHSFQVGRILDESVRHHPDEEAPRESL
jgi:hypothetical protein